MQLLLAIALQLIWHEVMDVDNNIRSGNLGVLVVMAAVPIVVYMLAFFFLGWIAEGFK
jgi:hypothetical protein